MKKLSVLILILAITTILLPQERTIGLMLNNEEKSCEGYILIAPKHYQHTYLIDNDGKLIHSWEKCEYEPGQSVYLYDNGDLLRCCFVKGGGLTAGGEGGRMEMYDWDDNLIWEFDYSTDKYLSHHDVALLPNGNILALVVEYRSKDECIQAGFDPEKLDQQIDKKGMVPDYVAEIKPIFPKGGEIVWEWHVWDHLIQDFDSSKDNYANPSEHPELIDPNGSGKKVPSFWNHMNSINYNTELDQVVLSVRGSSEFWVIDHSTTTEEAKGHTGGKYGKGGDLLYRWGNPSEYGLGTSDDQQLYQQHDSQWIESGCPGAGNFLIFNNGLNRPDGSYSSVDEIVSPMDENGFYPMDEGKAFGPTEILWSYQAENRFDFFAEAISGAQRLPNGNTLICDGTHGRLFEITPEKELVWDYLCPVSNNGIMNQGDEIELDIRNHQYNAVFKVHRYPSDFPGFEGKDMTPGEPIEIYPTSVDEQSDMVPNEYKLNQNYPNPFNPITRISYQLPSSDNVVIKNYDVVGKEIQVLVNEKKPAGYFDVLWDATNKFGHQVNSGIYFYKLQSGNYSVIKKMTLLK